MIWVALGATAKAPMADGIGLPAALVRLSDLDADARARVGFHVGDAGAGVDDLGGARRNGQGADGRWYWVAGGVGEIIRSGRRRPGASRLPRRRRRCRRR